MINNKKNEVIKKLNYAKKSEEELNIIARDILSNSIYTNININDNINLYKVFPVILVMNESIREFLNKNSPGLIYEYLSKKIMMDKGLPIFKTVNFLSKEDGKKVFVIIEKLVKEEK